MMKLKENREKGVWLVLVWKGGRKEKGDANGLRGQELI